MPTSGRGPGHKPTDKPANPVSGDSCFRRGHERQDSSFGRPPCNSRWPDAATAIPELLRQPLIGLWVTLQVCFMQAMQYGGMDLIRVSGWVAVIVAAPAMLVVGMASRPAPAPWMPWSPVRSGARLFAHPGGRCLRAPAAARPGQEGLLQYAQHDAGSAGRTAVHHRPLRGLHRGQQPRATSDRSRAGPRRRTVLRLRVRIVTGTGERTPAPTCARPMSDITETRNPSSLPIADSARTSSFNRSSPKRAWSAASGPAFYGAPATARSE
jgi:hypothetical protein